MYISYCLWPVQLCYALYIYIYTHPPPVDWDSFSVDRVAWIFLRMHPYAFICIRHASVYTQAPPYAPFTFQMSISKTCSQKNPKDDDSPKSQNSNCDQERQIGPNPSKYTKMCKHG